MDISKACSGASSLPLPFAKSTSTPRGQALVQVHKVLLRSVLLVLGLFALRYLSPYLQLPGSSSRTINGVQWKSCGDNFQCANVSVPLDHHNASDARMVSIAVVRLLAADKENRCVNVDTSSNGNSFEEFVGKGPYFSTLEGLVRQQKFLCQRNTITYVYTGGSGTDFVYRRGPQLSKILKGACIVKMPISSEPQHVHNYQVNST